MSPLNTDAETETDINAALLTMSFEVPLGPLSGYGSAPKSVTYSTHFHIEISANHYFRVSAKQTSSQVQEASC